MTYSIVARDPDTGSFGVAVATGNLAVGAMVPHCRAGVGAVATQGTTNPMYGPRGLDLLAAGHPAQTVVDILTQADRGRAHRQLHVIDREGHGAAWTGTETVPWAGHRLYPNFSVAGNMLLNPDLLEAMIDAYQASTDLAFVERLIRALEAAEGAGGDKRGCLSAAIYVVETEDYGLYDLRVDHHAEPLTELRRLLAETEKAYYTSFRATVPTKANPHNY